VAYLPASKRKKSKTTAENVFVSPWGQVDWLCTSRLHKAVIFCCLYITEKSIKSIGILFSSSFGTGI